MPIFSRTGATMPSLSSTSAASRWSGASSELPCSEASSFARWTASCAFTVNFSQRIAMIYPSGCQSQNRIAFTPQNELIHLLSQLFQIGLRLLDGCGYGPFPLTQVPDGCVKLRPQGTVL